MSPVEEEYEEIQVKIRLKKNVLEVAKILSICYSNYGDKSNEMFDNFCSNQIDSVVHALAEAPIEPPTFPESLKELLRRKINEDIITSDIDKEELN